MLTSNITWLEETDSMSQQNGMEWLSRRLARLPSFASHAGKEHGFDVVGMLVSLENVAKAEMMTRQLLAGIFDDDDVLRGKRVERVFNHSDQQHGDDHQEHIDDVHHTQNGIVAVVIVQDVEAHASALDGRQGLGQCGLRHGEHLPDALWAKPVAHARGPAPALAGPAVR